MILSRLRSHDVEPGLVWAHGDFWAARGGQAAFLPYTLARAGFGASVAAVRVRALSGDVSGDGRADVVLAW